MKGIFNFALCIIFYAVLIEADQEPYNPRVFTCSLLKYTPEKCTKQADHMCGYDTTCSYKVTGRSNIRTRSGGSDMVLYIEFNKIIY